MDPIPTLPSTHPHPLKKFPADFSIKSTSDLLRETVLQKYFNSIERKLLKRAVVKRIVSMYAVWAQF